MLPAIVTPRNIRPVCKLLYLVALHEKKAAWTSHEMSQAAGVSLAEVEEAFSHARHSGLGHCPGGSHTGFVFVGVDNGEQPEPTKEEGPSPEGLSSSKPKRNSKGPGT